MKFPTVAPIAAALLLGSGVAAAACPPLSVYQVSGINAADSNLAQAAKLLFAGTAWKAATPADAPAVPVNLVNVAGPLDKVVHAVATAASNNTFAVSTVSDPEACTVTWNVIRRAPVPAPTAIAAKTRAPTAQTFPTKGAPPAAVPTKLATAATPRPKPAAPAPKPVAPVPVAPAPITPVPALKPYYVLRKGEFLSDALGRYVKSQGWTLQWNLPDNRDYMLTAAFPIPAGSDIVAGVKYVISAYRAQGGLLGATVIFATPNRIVSVQPSKPADQTTYSPEEL